MTAFTHSKLVLDSRANILRYFTVIHVSNKSGFHVELKTIVSTHLISKIRHLYS
jgi:hypothetical protein